MTLDIRFPVGILFAIVGVLLVGYGLASDPAIYQRSLGVNVNLDWGLILLIFGIVMIVMGRHITNVNRRAAISSQEQLSGQHSSQPGH